MKGYPIKKRLQCVAGIVLIGNLAGCSSRDEALYGYGTLAFIIFILLVGSSIALHYGHSKPMFQSLRIRSRRMIIPISFLAIPVGAAFSVYSVTQEGALRIGIFIGVLICALFYALQLWARSESIEKQRLCMKVAQLSLSFILVLIFLYLGGEGLK